MKKFAFLLLLLLLVAALLTKPDDKTCIIGGVKAVWGSLVPDPDSSPEYFEQFMDLHSRGIKVSDWIFFKQIKVAADSTEQTVALGAFNKIFPRVRPVEHNPYIPKMPAPKKS